MHEKTTQAGSLPDKARAIDRLLAGQYGEPEWSPKLDPISELVLTILSQHTSDKNSGQAFDDLYAHFGGDWTAVMYAPTEEVAAAIRSAGLSNIKAPRIQAVLREIQIRTGGLDLGFLSTMPLDESRKWLTSLSGVGPKTAACVLMFSFGLPVMPVDTHVHRVSRRLGLIGAKVNAELAHDQLLALAPPERVYPFHINLIRHGRLICKAPVPRCALCPLKDLCEYYQEARSIEEQRT